MPENDVIINYRGHFTFEKIGSLLNKLKDETESRGISVIYYKKILSIMIESLENVFRYNEFFEKEQFLFPKYLPYFSLEQSEGFFILSTGNPVLNKDVEKLREKIDRVNKQDKEGLRQIFRLTLTDGQFTKKGGAGLGFIEMSKVAGGKIQYRIEPINDTYSYYHFILPIPIKTNHN
jgi:hypothetical protein